MKLNKKLGQSSVFVQRIFCWFLCSFEFREKFLLKLLSSLLNLSLMFFLSKVCFQFSIYESIIEFIWNEKNTMALTINMQDVSILYWISVLFKLEISWWMISLKTIGMFNTIIYYQQSSARLWVSVTFLQWTKFQHFEYLSFWIFR